MGIGVMRLMWAACFLQESTKHTSSPYGEGGFRGCGFVRRNNNLELEVDKKTHEELVRIAILMAKCWNEVHFLRKQQYRSNGIIDFNGTRRGVYHKYKVFLGVNADQVINKNVEAWRSFFSLKKEKAKGELPEWFKPRPPGYWKDRDGRYKLMVVIRNYKYVINEEKSEIFLKDFNLTLKYKGELKWKGKQGRLEIEYDPARRKWYAHVPVEVEDRQDVPVLDQGMKASVDLGIKNLAVLYIQDGTWYIFKGGSVFSQFEYYTRKIALLQSAMSKCKHKTGRRLELLYEKRKLNKDHALKSMVRKIFEILQEKNIKTIVVGYPKGINLDHGNKSTVNFWSYFHTIKRFQDVGEELGIKVIVIKEWNTSQECSVCGAKDHENNNENQNNNENNNVQKENNGGRVKRGLYICPIKKIAINADLNSAINILSKAFPHEQWDKLNWTKHQPIIYHWINGAWKQKPTKPQTK